MVDRSDRHWRHRRVASLCTVLALLAGCGGDSTGKDSGDGAPRDAACCDAAGQGKDSGEPPIGPAMDAATPADGGDPGDGGAAPEEMPMSIFDTGLYANRSTLELAEGVRAYVPRSTLWSDGAVKQRYLALPAGSQIDTQKMDSWSFPSGTRAWKEFRVGGRLIETRLLEKQGDRWFMMAYAWNAAGDDAVAVVDGAPNALGTTHDVPPQDACEQCHNGASDGLLGVDAVQLAYDSPALSLAVLQQGGELTHAPNSSTFALPGDANTRFALGYFHANCSHCHNPRNPKFGMAGELDLSLRSDALDAVEATAAYQSTVGVALHIDLQPYQNRIVAGDPSTSGLVVRMMRDKTDDLAMPPLASEVIDASAVSTIEDWISGL